MISTMIANSDVTLQAEATIPESGTQMAPSLLLYPQPKYPQPKYPHFIAQPKN